MAKTLREAALAWVRANERFYANTNNNKLYELESKADAELHRAAYRSYERKYPKKRRPVL